jgi:hypothetical protein
VEASFIRIYNGLAAVANCYSDRVRAFGVGERTLAVSDDLVGGLNMGHWREGMNLRCFLGGFAG